MGNLRRSSWVGKAKPIDVLTVHGRRRLARLKTRPGSTNERKATFKQALRITSLRITFKAIARGRKFIQAYERQVFGDRGVGFRNQTRPDPPCEIGAGRVRQFQNSYKFS